MLYVSIIYLIKLESLFYPFYKEGVEMFLVSSIKNRLDNIMNIIALKKYHVRIGKKTQFHGIVSTSGGGTIEIGNNCTISSGKRANPIGGDVRCVFNFGTHGKIVIGNKCGLSNVTIVANKEVVLEDNVLIGGGVKLYDTDFHSIRYSDRVNPEGDKNIKCESIIIHEGAFIGAHSIILKGVSIGRHSVIGAGSVVTKSVPDGEIWAGNPAKYVKDVLNE